MTHRDLQLKQFRLWECMNTGQIVLRVFQTVRDLTLKTQELYLGRELPFLWQRPSMFPSDIPSSVDRWSTSRSSDTVGVLETGQLCLVCQSDFRCLGNSWGLRFPDSCRGGPWEVHSAGHAPRKLPKLHGETWPCLQTAQGMVYFGNREQRRWGQMACTWDSSWTNCVTLAWSCFSFLICRLETTVVPASLWESMP